MVGLIVYKLLVKLILLDEILLNRHQMALQLLTVKTNRHHLWLLEVI